MTMRVPFVDIKGQNASIRTALDTRIGEIIDRAAFAGGPYVARFEERFAAAHDASRCVAVNSGTAALHIALWALGVGPGDDVILPANTFFATAEAVSLVGATPVFADCDPETFNLDPAGLEALRTPRTRAVIAVHLYGQPAAMGPIQAFTERHGLLLLEDCAQAHLAALDDRKVGTFGAAGCFSFYPGKNLGALGEGGAVVTMDPELADRMQAIKDHGSRVKYQHDILGHNYRMEGLQGGVLDVKLDHLPAWTNARRRNAARYTELLAEIPQVTTPAVLAGTNPVWHLYVIRTKERDALSAFLKAHGVASGRHYPVPCHLQKPYRDPARPPAPQAERLAGEILSLPMSEMLTEEQIDFAVDRIKAFFSRGA